MTSGNEFKLGGNNGNSVDLTKVKSGVKREAFESDVKLLKVFDAVDCNSNQTLDMNEVTVFTENLKKAANGDEIISKKEAEQIFKEQQEKAKAQGEDAKKYDIKSKDLFGFMNKFLEASEKSNVKSSVVDEQGNQTLTYEDGSQEILNKDGSKVLIQVVDGKKLSKTLDREGNTTEEVYTNEESGDTETLSYEGGKLKSHTTTSKGGNLVSVLSTEEGFAKGKPIKQIIGQGTENEQTVEYNYTDENSYTANIKSQDTEETVVVNNGVVESSVKSIYKDGVKVQEVSQDKEGTQTNKGFDSAGNLRYDAVITSDGTKTETTYNEDGHKRYSQITTPDGNVRAAKYDGTGNTFVVVQNGETVASLGSKFGVSTSDIASVNKGSIHSQNGSYYFTAGQQVKVPGEFAPDYKGLQKRLSSEQVSAQYAAQEQQRVAQRLQGKELKEVTIEKDYANLTDYAKDLLRSELGREPSKEEYTNKTNELGVINGNMSIVPKKGMKIQTTKTEAELEKERIAAFNEHMEEALRNPSTEWKVVSQMQDELDKAQNSFDEQMKKDGWAADVADAVSYVWNNDWWSLTGNTARQVRQDLEKYAGKVNDLMDTIDPSDAGSNQKFKAKFKEIYGVEYNAQKIEDYHATRKKMEQISTITATERAVTSKMDALFADYDKENAYLEQYRRMPNTLTDESKLRGVEFRIQKEMQNILGLSDSDMIKLSQELQSKGKTLDTNYLRQLYGEVKTGLAKQRKEATGGKSVIQYQLELNRKYVEAFGNKSENDIAKRVADYNSSQDTGAAVVKTGVKIVGSAVIAAASGGTASGLLIAAVGSSALSFGVEASDMLSDGLEHSGSEYFDKAKDAVVDGAAQFISGGSSKLLKAAEVSKYARYATQAAVDMTLDGGLEYARTGEVQWSTLVMSGLSSVGGEMLGDFLEARAERKQFDLGPINEDALPSRDSSWLASTSEIEAMNPDHVRHDVFVSASEMGGVKTADLGNGIRGIVDDPGHIHVDVSSAQMKAAVADVASLPGIDVNSDFGRGLVKLENIQQAKTSYSASASGAPKYAGATGDNVKTYGTFSSNQQVIAMGLQDDKALVQDCATLAGRAYSNTNVDAVLLNGEKPVKGLSGNWERVLSQTDESTGFHAKAYKDGDRVIVAFRGSDDASDLVSDFRMMAGRTPEQLQNATAFIDKIKEMHPDAKIIVTGHSLGGSLTEMVASRYDDVLGITFDAVGTKVIVDATAGALKDNHNTVNYIINGDVLSNADTHVGQVVLTDAVVQNGKLNSPHAIGNFMGTGNNSLVGVEQGLVAKTVDVHTKSPKLADLVGTNAAESSVKIDGKKFKGISSQFEYDVNTLGADLDALQSQISAVADPNQRAQLQTIIDARREAITKGTDISSNSHTIRYMSGDEINDVLARDYGFTEPGFLGGNTPSAEIVVDKPTKLVRVFNDENSFAKGSWLMPYDQIVGKSPEEIKDFFALPNMPKYIVEVEVPEGTRMFTGLCNPLEGWGNGGGTQFFVAGDVRPKEFGQMRLIKGAKN